MLGCIVSNILVIAITFSIADRLYIVPRILVSLSSLPLFWLFYGLLRVAQAKLRGSTDILDTHEHQLPAIGVAVVLVYFASSLILHGGLVPVV